MSLLSDQVALVTGGAGAIGMGIAAACGDAGAKVAVADRDPVRLSHAVEALSARGNEVVGVPLDITSAQQWEAAVDDIEQRLGPVQLLFNNAGVSALGVPVEDMSIDYFSRVLAVNATSVVLGAQTIISRMRALGLNGHIVTTSSIMGLGVALAGGGAYAASKCAAVAISEALELELAGTGIKVSVLCPGPVRSELWKTSRSALQLPEVDVAPEASRRGSASPDAMDPMKVGRIAVQALARGSFYIVTHPEFVPDITSRHARMAIDLGQKWDD